MNENLTAEQKDYAVFLPAVSSFYSTFIGKQRFGNYVDPARLPMGFTNGVEGLNFFDPEKGYFYYKWGLYSAGHADLDMTRSSEKDDMFRSRPRNGDSIVLGDSGGFQIGKGVWEGEWRDPNGPEVQALMATAIAKGIEEVQVLDKNGNTKKIKIDHVKLYQARLDAAQKKRDQVLTWMDGLMDWGMCLDIPAWVARSPAGMAATGISSYQDAVNATKYNNEYFMKHRNGNCKFLNVLQGETHTDAEDWYQQMKDYCDPKIYPETHFNGWSMGGQNMCDVHLMLKRLVAIRFDGLLEKGKQDWMHFLGTSKLEWASLLTDTQRAIRKYHHDTFTISFDCASPFLATANGQIYTQVEIEHMKKWVYRMVPSVDDKKYSLDSRAFSDAVLQDGIFDAFSDSPISARSMIRDVCVYKPGDLNKNGKEGRTSWDSFSYAIQMGHNVWTHINAVQEANRQYDQGVIPNMMAFDMKSHLEYYRDVVDRIFETDDREKALALVEDYNKFWISIIGTRGATGKKTINSATHFNSNFITEMSQSIEDVIETTEASKAKVTEEHFSKLFDFS
jgi:hypothetical protein